MEKVKQCERCGKDYKSRANNSKWCPDCLKIIKRLSAHKAYYAKLGQPVPERILKRFEYKKPPTPPAQKQTLKCGFEHCPFKSGNRPCMFYFEYKDGTKSCPGKRFMKGSDNFGLEKRSD